MDKVNDFVRQVAYASGRMDAMVERLTNGVSITYAEMAEVRHAVGDAAVKGARAWDYVKGNDQRDLMSRLATLLADAHAALANETQFGHPCPLYDVAQARLTHAKNVVTQLVPEVSEVSEV